MCGNPGNGRWLRNLTAKCFSEMTACLGSCSLGLVHISNDKMSCLAKGNVVVSLFRHERGRTNELISKQSSMESVLWLDVPWRLSKGFVRSLFEDAALHAESHMQADDIILIGTGGVVDHVGTATLQNLVHKACIENLDQDHLARSILDVANQHAYVAGAQLPIVASCVVGFLVESHT